jgi:hypothetical protein
MRILCARALRVLFCVVVVVVVVVVEVEMYLKSQE